MKEQDLLKTLGDVDEKFIVEAAPTDYPEAAETPDYTEIITRKEPFYMKILPIAACLAFVGVGITAGVLIKNTALNPAYQTTPSSYPTCEWLSSASEVQRVPEWDELEFTEQYPRFEFEGCGYDTAGADVFPQRVGPTIGRIICEGHDEATGETHQYIAHVYPIEDINTKCAVAVRFDNSINYYVYYNRNYIPQTLGDFIDDFNLMENIEISDTATGTTIENYRLTEWKYSGIDTGKLRELLLTSKNSLNEYYFNKTFTDEEREIALEFSVDIPVLGIKNLSLAVTKGGFVKTNAYFNNSLWFYLGTYKTDSFVQYVKENCKSEITRQSDEPDEKYIRFTDEERESILSLFKEWTYLACNIHPGSPNYDGKSVDLTQSIEVELNSAKTGYTTYKQTFYKVTNSEYSTKEKIKEKLNGIFTEDFAGEIMNEFVLNGEMYFENGETYVSKNVYFPANNITAKVEISAQKVNGEKLMTLKQTIDGESEWEYPVYFINQNGKIKIKTCEIDSVSRVFFPKNVSVSFLFCDEAY